MFVLFEEDGAFKAGTLFSESDASIQVEMPTGKRTKVKRSSVLLMYAEPGRDALLPSAQQLAADLDPAFLWECAPQDEFGFEAFAQEIYSEKPTSVQQAAVLLALHQAPMYFYRKGRGQYKAAPEDALKAALAGAERKRQAAIAQQAMHDALVAGELPQEIASQALQLLIKPDKQSIVHKALESAANALAQSPARLLLSRGALPSVYALHRARFMQQCFSSGTGFGLSEDDLREPLAAADKLDLPLAAAPAYSIDDASTTEIDDAFSLQPRDGGGWRVGIHIACPGIAIAPQSAVGKLARERASTVYFPGDKITMLPPTLIERFSLDEGCQRPVLSLIVDFDAQGDKISSASRVEFVHIERNVRLGDWESELEQDFESIDPARLPWDGLKVLLFLARRLRQAREAVRGKPEIAGRMDFNFDVRWNASNADALAVGDGRPQLTTRRRGSPVDVLVSEFMILANTSWGDMLALARLPGVYRVQTFGRVRMQTQPGPHQGLGVDNYAWSTSPLRRFSDLINQWQMLAVLGLRTPAFKGGDADLFSAVTQFDVLYNQYADFQEMLERYWSLRWLGMEHGLEGAESWSAVARGVSIREKAVALREGAFRLRRAPVVLRCADAPPMSPGVEVELELLASDALELSVQARFVSVTSAAPVEEEETVVASQFYAVLGDPIAHSKSPFIHAEFAKQTAEQLQYQAIRVTAEQLAAEIERLASEGFGGVNLTVPLKEQAFALARSQDWELSQRAISAGAINTIRFDPNGFIYGDNTDGAGLVRDLERLLGAPGSLADQCVLLIGAGGAARGVIGPLRDAGVRHIRIANRSFEKAQAIADQWAEMDATSSQWLSVMPLQMLTDPFSEDPPAVRSPDAEASGGGNGESDWADSIIVNATSASLAGDLIPMHASRLAHARVALDMMYASADTPFVVQARQAGTAVVADGLGMLVEQAAESFALWRGVRPETASVLAQLRLQLAAR